MDKTSKNMIRIGQISSINYISGKVKVAFGDKDNIVSTELPYLSFEYNMPSVGDMVLCIFLGNGISQGFCLGKYFNTINMPGKSGSNIYYKDFFGEGFIEYDKSTKTLTLSADNISFLGNLSINGSLNVNGDVIVTGKVTASEFVTIP